MQSDLEKKIEQNTAVSKKAYEAPELSEYGNVNELTKGTGLLLTDGTVITGSVVSTITVLG